MQPPTHTILGAGQVGLELARMLAAAGLTVRLVRRGPPREAIPGIVWMRGDVTDRAFADEACRGAAVVYNCTNPADYTGWDELLAPLATAVRDAAGRAGARLVVLDNLYMYGKPETAPFDESTPMRPCSRKGELRARLVEQLWAAHARGDVRATSGHASDYFGPDTPLSVVFRPRFYQRLAAGKSLEVMGDPDQPHSYSYVPDVARGLMILGTSDAAVGHRWHLPVAAQLTTRELVERFATAAGRPARLRRIPGWMLKAVGVFVPLAGALGEMIYQWELPYLIDDGAFRRAFGVDATPLDRAIDTCLRAYSIALPVERAA